MAAKFPSVAGKIVLVVVAVAMVGLLFVPSAAGEARRAGEDAVASPRQQEHAQCNHVWEPYITPDCDTWCWNEGHPGGYVKGDVCCCNSGGLAADS